MISSIFIKKTKSYKVILHVLRPQIVLEINVNNYRFKKVI